MNKMFSRDHHFKKTSEDFIDLSKKTNIDVIFFGSSMTYTSYNPGVFDDICKTVSYNIGSPSLNMSLTDLVLQETLKYTTPELIILTHNERAFGDSDLISEKGKGRQLHALDFIYSFSLKKWKKIKSIYTSNEFLGVYFPLIRNHNKWNDDKRFSLSRSKNYKTNKKKYFYFSGYLGYYRMLEDKKLEEKFNNYLSSHKKQKNITKKIMPKQKSDFINFVKIANDKGIDVLVVSPLDIESLCNENSFHTELEQLCISQNASYIDLNKHYKELDLEFEDFLNHNHLNLLGGEKISRFLASFINNKFQLPDRSSDDIWKKKIAEYRKHKATKKEVKDKTYKAVVEKNFTRLIKVKDITIKRNKREILFTLSLDNSKEIQKELEKYKMAVQIYPKKNDMKSLSETSKSKAWNYDKKNVLLGNTATEIKFTMYSGINDIDRIKLFLFNTEEFKGIIGKTLIIENPTFE